MSIDANKTLLANAVSNFSLATLDAYLQLYDPDATLHFLPPGLPPGREGARLFYSALLRAFPDARLTLVDVISEEDKAAARFAIEGTHRGEFLGVPASGKPVSISGITIFRFAGGRCVERWTESNLRAVLAGG